MHTEKVNEILAHFIGLFETATDEARIRCEYLLGPTIAKAVPQDVADDTHSEDFKSLFELKSYDPEISYTLPAYDVPRLNTFEHGRACGHLSDTSGTVDPIAPDGATLPFRIVGNLGNSLDAADGPLIVGGPGSLISHLLQANVLYDDDVLNMTETAVPARDLSQVGEKLAQYLAEAVEASPFTQINQIDALQSLSAFVTSLTILAAGGRTLEERESGDAPHDGLATDEHSDVFLAADSIEGIYVNGARAEAAPELGQYLPNRDRGAERAEDPVRPEDAESTVHADAGANIVGNVLSVVSTGIIAPVTAVMGDYHQIDAISQSYIYADGDTLDAAIGSASDIATKTVALNIASFERHDSGPLPEDERDPSGVPSTFPTSWRVSVVECDMSFVQWIEQYSFVSDNDTMTITTSGVETTVLTGGNAVVNFASFLGIGGQYDLVIVGGQVLDLNVISQISILYDNDHVQGISGGSGMVADGGGNLVWNMASIENVGSNERFEVMPDYMHEVIGNIRSGDDELPGGLAHDQNFDGYASLHVLYITGNLYDVSVVKQISILGDSDAVSYVAGKMLEEEAEVTVHTGDNTVINIAEIIDCDSFSQTTYVGGGVYSDSILIQSGIIDGSTDAPGLQPAGNRLANEIIAFVGDDDPPQPAIDAGNDTALSDDQWNDVMHTVLI